MLVFLSIIMMCVNCVLNVLQESPDPNMHGITLKHQNKLAKKEDLFHLSALSSSQKHDFLRHFQSAVETLLNDVRQSLSTSCPKSPAGAHAQTKGGIYIVYAYIHITSILMQYFFFLLT